MLGKKSGCDGKERGKDKPESFEGCAGSEKQDTDSAIEPGFTQSGGKGENPENKNDGILGIGFCYLLGW